MVCKIESFVLCIKYVPKCVPLEVFSLPLESSERQSQKHFQHSSHSILLSRGRGLSFQDQLRLFNAGLRILRLFQTCLRFLKVDLYRKPTCHRSNVDFDVHSPRGCSKLVYKLFITLTDLIKTLQYLNKTLPGSFKVRLLFKQQMSGRLPVDFISFGGSGGLSVIGVKITIPFLQQSTILEAFSIQVFLFESSSCLHGPPHVWAPDSKKNLTSGIGSFCVCVYVGGGD